MIAILDDDRYEVSYTVCGLIVELKGISRFLTQITVHDLVEWITRLSSEK